MRLLASAALLCVFLVVPAFAAEAQRPETASASALDSKSIWPSLDLPSFPKKSTTSICFSMRTYRVRKDLDRKSVIPATPDEVSFDPDSIIGYSTCQRADKFDLHTTH